MRSRLAVLSVVALCLALPAAPTPASARAEPACTIIGTPGPDVLLGTRGPDVICGRGGDDVLRGLGGDDILRGGPGQDILQGLGGFDTLLGGADGDDLFDQTALLRDGGPGADWCPGIDDSRASCMNEDTSPPRVTKVGLSRTSIHLGTDDQIVVARVTVQDDVGIHKVSFHLSDGRVTLPLEGLPWGATRSSGTARDGIYRLRIRVPAHVEPGSYELWVRIRPRVGPDSETSYLTLPVEADQPDVAGPVLEQVIKPGPAVTYHVDQTPTVKLRVTDALAGARRVSVCYRRMPGPSGPHCNLASLVSGSAQDGMWRARLTDLRYLGEGDGEIYIDIGDDAGNSGLWRGPSAVDIPGALLIPGGVGAFTVVP